MSTVNLGWSVAQSKFAVPDELHTRQAFMLGILCGLQAGRIAVERGDSLALDLARHEAMKFWEERIKDQMPQPLATAP